MVIRRVDRTVIQGLGPDMLWRRWVVVRVVIRRADRTAWLGVMRDMRSRGVDLVPVDTPRVARIVCPLGELGFSVQTDAGVLQIQIFVDSEVTPFTTHSGLLDSSEGRLRCGDSSGIQTNHAEFHRFGNAPPTI